MAELPTFLGSYRVQHQIGVGTLGPIFLASDEVLHVTAAVKLFDVDARPDEIAALVQRLNATAARLSSHPGIIKLFEAGVANHVAYLATEHAEGMSLDARLRERDAALPSESLGWLDAMADAIDAIHADGVDHGSLHPRDVVLTLDGPRISGCGVARAIEEVGLRAPARLPYTAPERAAGPSWGRAADVFSLAAIAFECLAGRRPTGTGRAAAKRLPPTVSPEYDRALVDIFARGLSADAERRPPSARAFVQGLLDAGAAYVYGGDAKRGAVHHRAGARPQAAATRAAVQTEAADGANVEGELARFARDGVLPEASGPSRPRRRTSAQADRKPAPDPEPEPSDAADPLTLFQPESDEPRERRPADEAGDRGAKGKRRRTTNGATAPAPASSEPANLAGAANGEEAETATDLHVQGAEGEADPEGAFTASGPEEDSAQSVDEEEVEPEGEPFDAAQGTEDEGATSAPADEGADRSTPAGARWEAEGWLASTMAVPLVDAQDEVEYPSQMADIPAGPGADAPVPEDAAPDDRFLDVEAPADHGHGSRRQGPSELGGAMAEGAPEAAGGGADPDEELTASLDIGPNGRNADWPLDRGARGAAAAGASTLFADDANDWDDEVDAPRRRRFLFPVLLLLLTVAAGAWFYGALTMPPSPMPSTEQASDADAVGAPPSAGETPDTGPAGQQPSNVAGLEQSGRADRREATDTPTARRAEARPERSREARPEGRREARASSEKTAARGTTGADQRPDRGRLLVRTSPSATITVDGVPRGSSPLAVYALDWGAHTVVASRPGYADVSRRVMIAPDSAAVTVTMDLREEAAGANASEDSTATVPDAPAAASSAAAPSSRTGAIVTVTRPTGAEILVDGKSAGRTPATIPNVPSGSHTVRFELTGYRVWETRVTVEPGQRVRIAASLDRGR